MTDTRTSMPIVGIRASTFEDMRDGGRLQSDTYYIVRYDSGNEYVGWTTHEQIAWSPDGIGCFWYDTLDEALAQHG